RQQMPENFLARTYKNCFREIHSHPRAGCDVRNQCGGAAERSWRVAGVRGEDSVQVLGAYEYIEVAATKMFGHNKLHNGPLPLRDTLYRKGSTTPVYCAGRRIHSGSIRVMLDRGEEYHFGRDDFDVTVQLRIDVKDA